MSATLADLLADPALRLRLAVNGGPGALERPVAFAASSELADPSAFLDGGELVLTTGLRLSSRESQETFVRSVAGAGAVGLGFGTGSPGSQLPHEAIPEAVLATAADIGLPVLEVPEETPFVGVGKLVSRQTAEAHASMLSGLLVAHAELASTLIAGGRERGQQEMLTALARMTRGPIQLHRYGSTVIEVPAPGRAEPGAGPGEEPVWQKQPIATGFKDRAALWTVLGEGSPPHAAAAVDYARSLLGVELANDNRALVRERQAAGQTLKDVMSGTVRGPEAAARMRALGIDEGPHHCVVVTVPSGQRRALASLPIAGGREAGLRALGVVRTAVIEDELLLVTLRDATEDLLGVLYRAGLTARVGVSRSYQWAGLTWAWHEARSAARRAGVGESSQASRVSMTSLLLASSDSPTTELAEQTVRALAGEHGDLLRTLRCYLDKNGAVQDVATELGVHRNSVRYRIESVRQITGHDATTIEGAAHLHLALAAWDLAHPEAAVGRDVAAQVG